MDRAAVVVAGLPVSSTMNTIVPIPIGHSVNMSDSDSYRGIALDSNFSKLFNNNVLHLR